MPSRTIQPQDPSASPTFSHSQSAVNNVSSSIPPTLRRNLFASHLSRRPAPPPHTLSNSTSTSAETLPDPFQSTPAAFRRTISQQNIFAQPPPTLSPTASTNARSQYFPANQDGNGSDQFSQQIQPAVSPKRSLSSTATTQVNSSHPQIYTSPQTQSYAQAPSHVVHNVVPQPSRTPVTNNNNNSILYIDPTTARPVIPTLPSLPPRLRISDDDDEQDLEEAHNTYSEEHTGAFGARGHARNVDFSSSTSAYQGHVNGLHTASGMDTAALVQKLLKEEGLDDGEDDYGSFERIEGILTEMQRLQKERARSLLGSGGIGNSNIRSDEDTPSGVSTRSRKKGRADSSRPATDNGKSKTTSCLGSGVDTRSGSGAPIVASSIGATIPPIEKEEMLGLIMTSLAKKIARTEDENWMYGESY